MLRITKESIREAGACNFCQRGELANTGLKFPYRTVFVLRGNTIAVSICEECLNIIKKNKN